MRTEVPPQHHQAVIRNRRWLVWGLGRLGGGVGVTRWLASEGAEVSVMDRAPADTLQDSVAAISNLPIRSHLGREDEALLSDVDAVVVNPAIAPQASEFFSAMLRRGIPWTTEINLFLERCPARIIGVTGSYGKSTTSAMIAAILAHAAGEAEARGSEPHARVYLGGNIGRSLLTELRDMRSRDWVVLELSSAQLEHVPRIRCAVRMAVLTNLHPHHLDRHGTFEAYARAKLNILGRAGATAHLLLGPELSDIFQAEGRDDGAIGGLLRDRVRLSGAIVHPTAEPTEAIDIPVAGRHNQINARLALTLAKIAGVPERVARAGLKSFAGLPHRLERVGRFGGVEYINDSKATSPGGTQTALEAMDRPIIAIVGGAAIDEPLDACVNIILQRCRAVACLGETGRRFAESIRLRGTSANAMPLLEAEGMQEAVVWATRNARAGDVVLFSPGATSFDRYVNFEARGNHFKEVVQNHLRRSAH